MSDAILKQHAELLDKLACRTVMETYHFAEITRDPDLFASVWTDDAQFGSVKGLAAIREACVGFFKGMESITDLRISTSGWHVQVNGDSADVLFYIVAQLKVPQPDGTIKIILNDAGYKGFFVRMPVGWRIARLGGIKHPEKFHDGDIFAQLNHEEEVRHET